MSALFDDVSTKTLTATIGSPPASSANKLIAAWVKWDSTYSANSTNYAAQLAGTSGASPAHHVKVQRISTAVQGEAAYGDLGAGATISGFTEDAWHLVAMYIPGNDGVTNVYGNAYYDSATPTASATAAVASATAQDFQYLTIGQGGPQSSFTHWKGRVAEVAILPFRSAKQFYALERESRRGGDFLPGRPD